MLNCVLTMLRCDVGHLGLEQDSSGKGVEGRGCSSVEEAVKSFEGATHAEGHWREVEDVHVFFVGRCRCRGTVLTRVLEFLALAAVGKIALQYARLEVLHG